MEKSFKALVEVIKQLDSATTWTKVLMVLCLLPLTLFTLQLLISKA